MQKEEAHQEEAPSEDPEDEFSDTEMADDEDDLREEADVEVSSPLEDTDPAPGRDVVSPEEDALLMQPTSQPEGPVAGSHSPRSEAGMVAGVRLNPARMREGQDSSVRLCFCQISKP